MTASSVDSLSDHPECTIVKSKDEAVQVVESFTRDLGFTLNPAGELVTCEGMPMDWVTLHNGKILEFSNCEGYGPQVRVRVAKTF